MSELLNPTFFEPLSDTLENGVRYLAFCPRQPSLVLYSADVPPMPLLALSFQVLGSGNALEPLADSTYACLMQRPAELSESIKIQGLVNKDAQEVAIVVTNLLQDENICINLLDEVPNTDDAKLYYPKKHINGINVIKSTESYTIRADQRYNGAALVINKKLDEKSEAKTVVEDESPKSKKKNGLFYWFTAMPLKDGKFRDCFRGSFWKFSDFFVLQRLSLKRKAMSKSILQGSSIRRAAIHRAGQEFAVFTPNDAHTDYESEEENLEIATDTTFCVRLDDESETIVRLDNQSEIPKVYQVSPSRGHCADFSSTHSSSRVDEMGECDDEKSDDGIPCIRLDSAVIQNPTTSLPEFRLEPQSISPNKRQKITSGPAPFNQFTSTSNDPFANYDRDHAPQSTADKALVNGAIKAQDLVSTSYIAKQTQGRIIKEQSSSCYDIFDPVYESPYLVFGVSINESLKRHVLTSNMRHEMEQALFLEAAQWVKKCKAKEGDFLLQSLRDKKIYKESTCCICLEEKPDQVIVTCGHACLHAKCQEALVHCPLCRSTIFATFTQS